MKKRMQNGMLGLLVSMWCMPGWAATYGIFRYYVPNGTNPDAPAVIGQKQKNDTYDLTKHTMLGLVNSGRTATTLTVPSRLPDNQRLIVTTIGTCAFNQSPAQTINLPDMLTTIENHAFYKCTALTSITIPLSVTEVQHDAFSGCSALKTIKAPISLKGLFSESNLRDGNSATIVWYGDYTITWTDGFGGTIDTTPVMKGTVPTHANPTKAADAQYTYSFKAWSPAPTAAAANKTYTATWNKTVRWYRTTWKYEDGRTYASTTSAYGTSAELATLKSYPEKEPTQQYEYAFAGWYPAVTTTKGEASYTATYTQTLRKYTITWKGDDGTTLDTTTVAYGTVPTHAAPTKDEDDDYTYTFAGWDAEPVAVTGEATYTAVFTATAKTQPGADIGGAAGADALRVVGLAPTEAAGVWDVTVEPTLKEAVDFAAWVVASAGRIKAKTARDPSGVDAAVAQALEPVDSDPEKARVTLRVDTTDDTEEGGEAAGRAFIRIIAE